MLHPGLSLIAHCGAVPDAGLAFCANTALSCEEEPSYGSTSAHGVTAPLHPLDPMAPPDIYAASITGSPDSTSAS